MRSHSDDGPPVTTIWRAVSKFLAWLVAITLLCIALAYFKPQIERQAMLDSEVEARQSEKEGLEAENHRLKARLDWLKNDRAYLEVQARDRLNMAKEGETVVRFDEGK